MWRMAVSRVMRRWNLLEASTFLPLSWRRGKRDPGDPKFPRAKQGGRRPRVLPVELEMPVRIRESGVVLGGEAVMDRKGRRSSSPWVSNQASAHRSLPGAERPRGEQVLALLFYQQGNGIRAGCGAISSWATQLWGWALLIFVPSLIFSLY